MLKIEASWEFCKGCKHQITKLKVDQIYKKYKLTNNNFIYKNGSLIGCIKYKLKNKGSPRSRRDPKSKKKKSNLY